MAKNNDGFFARKSEWAFLKDDLLAHYLVPYLQKILATGKPLLYIDAFAGKGVFDDGEPGSPLIACERIEQAISNTHTGNDRVMALFVEKKYDADLGKNLADYSFARAVKGSYEELIDIMSTFDSPDLNVFLYVDPYGVKSLDQHFFLDLPQRFSTIELLINFNSFGFFRAACSACGIRFSEAAEVDGFILERDSEHDDTVASSEAKLIKAFGGEQWKVAVEDYAAGRIDGYRAEEIVATEYCNNLKTRFKYVQNLPIRVKESNHPKYRMVHACNHEQGCLLMYGRMQKRLLDMKMLQTGGQMSMFDSDDAGRIIDESEIADRLVGFINEIDEYVLLEQVLADFVSRDGLSVALNDFIKVVRNLEQSHQIDILRYPEYTKKLGRPSTFMESKQGQWIKVRRRKNEVC